MSQTETSLALPDTLHAAVVVIDYVSWQETFSDVLTVNSTDLQGTLREKGVYEVVHDRLRLPEQYTVTGIFYKWLSRLWHVVIEGVDLPVIEHGYEYPQVTPVYEQRIVDGVRIIRFVRLSV